VHTGRSILIPEYPSLSPNPPAIKTITVCYNSCNPNVSISSINYSPGLRNTPVGISGLYLSKGFSPFIDDSSNFLPLSK
jgi:hypothetical protein